LTELRVTFSKSMRAGFWAWVQLNDETYPETRGQPHFSDDARTCILPVRLQPGTVYAIWINHEKFSTFQDPEGQPAVPYLLVFKTKE
jgi:RNA polymerase sigma-70 factor (ECF subfamily)